MGEQLQGGSGRAGVLRAHTVEAATRQNQGQDGRNNYMTSRFALGTLRAGVWEWVRVMGSITNRFSSCGMLSEACLDELVDFDAR